MTVVIPYFSNKKKKNYIIHSYNWKWKNTIWLCQGVGGFRDDYFIYLLPKSILTPKFGLEFLKNKYREQVSR
jgi:hypothetical protein